MQANSFQVFSFLFLEVYLSSEVAVCVWIFFYCFMFNDFFFPPYVPFEAV